MEWCLTHFKKQETLLHRHGGDAVVPPKRRKSIFEAIIAKWSCTALQDSDNEAAGVLSEDEESNSSDDYDYEGVANHTASSSWGYCMPFVAVLCRPDFAGENNPDDLIDNSELQQAYEKKGRTKTSDFCIDDGGDAPKDEEDCQDCAADAEVGSKRARQDVNCEAKRPRLIDSRITRLSWMNAGDANFKHVNAVTDEILLKMGENGEKMEEGGNIILTDSLATLSFSRVGCAPILFGQVFRMSAI
jgi:hypothetical protein